MKILPSNVTSETVVQSVLMLFLTHTTSTDFSQYIQNCMSYYQKKKKKKKKKKKITPYTRGDDRTSLLL